MAKREHAVLGAILAVALVLRVAWCVHAARPPSGSLHDPNFYYLYAEQLATGDGYRLPDGSPTAYYPPGYAMALAPFFWLAFHTPLDRIDGIEVAIVAGLNIAWQLITIVLAYVLARRVAGRTDAGYVAAAALALWPNLIFHTAVALTESLFLVLLLAALVLAACAPWGSGRGWERWRIFAVGAAMGAATLVRPVTVLLFPAIGVVLLVSRAGWRRALGTAAAVAAVAVALVVPWAIRNAVVMGELTLSTNTGDNLCMSRFVGASGGFEYPNDRCFSGDFDALERPEFELARDRHGRAAAIEFVRDHPGEELRLWFRRLGATFDGDADGLSAVESYGSDAFLDDDVRDGLRMLATAYGLVVGLVLGGAGLVRLGLRAEPAPLLVALSAVAVLVPPVVFFGDPRFHVPAVPLAAVAAGCLLSELRPRGPRRRATTRS